MWMKCVCVENEIMWTKCVQHLVSLVVPRTVEPQKPLCTVVACGDPVIFGDQKIETFWSVLPSRPNDASQFSLPPPPPPQPTH